MENLYSKEELIENIDLLINQKSESFSKQELEKLYQAKLILESIDTINLDNIDSFVKLYRFFEILLTIFSESG